MPVGTRLYYEDRSCLLLTALYKNQHLSKLWISQLKLYCRAFAYCHRNYFTSLTLLTKIYNSVSVIAVFPLLDIVSLPVFAIFRITIDSQLINYTHWHYIPPHIDPSSRRKRLFNNDIFHLHQTPISSPKIKVSPRRLAKLSSFSAVSSGAATARQTNCKVQTPTRPHAQLLRTQPGFFGGSLCDISCIRIRSNGDGAVVCTCCGFACIH